MAETKKSGNKTIAENRKALHEYFVEESFEAGDRKSTRLNSSHVC